MSSENKAEAAGIGQAASDGTTPSSTTEQCRDTATNQGTGALKPRTKERKRGVSWTETEHKQFLAGLAALGKGDWRGISQTYVKTRTPTQVASHAQKHFIRRQNCASHKRRSSLFDMDTDAETQPVSRSSLNEAETLSQQANSANSMDWPASKTAQVDQSSVSVPISPCTHQTAQPMQPPGPGDAEMSNYHAMMQMHAAAAAGYAFGAQFPAHSIDTEPQHTAMAQSGPPPVYGVTQQQAAAWYAAASAANMAARAVLANDHGQPSAAPYACATPGYVSGAFMPAQAVAEGMTQRQGGMPGIPPSGEHVNANTPSDLPFAHPSTHQHSSHSLSHKDKPPGAWGKHHDLVPAMPSSASLGLGGSTVEDSAMDESSFEDVEQDPGQTPPPALLIKPKATLAQPSSATQAGFGCEPLMRSLATISKGGSAAASEGSGKSSMTPFNSLNMPIHGQSPLSKPVVHRISLPTPV